MPWVSFMAVVAQLRYSGGDFRENLMKTPLRGYTGDLKGLDGMRILVSLKLGYGTA